MSSYPGVEQTRAYHAGLAASRERILAGKAEGASAVRTLADMDPEERARVIAEIQANHAQKKPATPPASYPSPAAVCRPKAAHGGPKPPRRIREPLRITAEERAQEAEERASEPTPATEHVAPPVAQESPMPSSLDAARTLRAEVEALNRQLAEKRRAALVAADELEQEAHALREAAGAVPIGVELSPQPQHKPSKVGMTHGARGGPPAEGTQRARILALLTDVPTTPAAVAAIVGTSAACAQVELRKLVAKGLAERPALGLYRKAVAA